MVIVYAGNPTMVDNEMLAAVHTLPSDFIVLAEFNTARNIDWYFLRPGADGRCISIMVELKRTRHALRGTFNGRWERHDTAETWLPVSTNPRDANHFQQAVHAANELQHWLWSQQPLYRAAAELRPLEEFNVWPDLLILSPPGVCHQLPLSTPGLYGKVFYSIEECLAHVAEWLPKKGVPMNAPEITTLADTLGLTLLSPPQSPSAVPVPVRFARATPIPVPVVSTAPDEALLARIAQLEARIGALETRSLSAPTAILPYGPPPGRPVESAMVGD
jgi:hypothetical protein